MTLHAMLDLETMSTATNAVMLSIGAVKFDPAAEPGSYVDEFHVGIELTSYKNLIGNAPFSFDVDPKTMMFWLEAERDPARAAWLALQKVTLTTALEGFAAWYVGTPDQHDGGTTHPEMASSVWSNGATFDIAIVKRTYELVGMECPWHFRAENCYRTIFNLMGKGTAYPSPAGVAHDALSDAKWQADKLRIMFKALGLFHEAEA